MKPRIAIPTPTSTDLPYNRRCLPLYLQAIAQAGGVPVELPLTATRAELQAFVATCTGILLPGSPADVSPARYGQSPGPVTSPADLPREAADTLLLDHAEQHGKPVLGICYGLQSLNVHRGGTLLQDLAILPVNHPAGPAIAVAHTAALDPASLLGALAPQDEAPRSGSHPRLPVNSSHHQAVAIPGEDLRITARCPQDGVVEAVEINPSASKSMVLAVQWHPERSYSTSATSRALFARLIAAAAEMH